MVEITRDPNHSLNYDFTIKSGATKPVLDAQLTDSSGNAVDLSGATVELKLSEAGSDTLTVDSEAVINNATDGDISYVWNDGDTDDPGQYNAEFAVDYSGGTGANFEYDEIFPSAGFITIFIQEPL